jgi:hypothetical protein
LSTESPASSEAPAEETGIPIVLGVGADSDDADGIGGIGEASINAVAELPGGVLGFTLPALVVSVPGLLLLLAIGAQAIGALAWLPVVRRRMGGLGVRHD